MKKKILVVFGTRPEAIKMAPLVKALKRNSSMNSVTCVSGQHREMLDQALNIFDLEADLDLQVMEPGQHLTDLTLKVIDRTRDTLESEAPDLVLVHGDTTTSFAAALASFYQQIPVGHVEAGLRTFDVQNPYPEEFNRRGTALMAKFHFAPTPLSRDRLLKEKVPDENIVVTGNTVIDALSLTIAGIERDISRKRAIQQYFEARLNFNWRSDRFVLITGHRRENFGIGFENICAAIKQLAGDHPNTHFVYPVHLNPRVSNPVNRRLSNLSNVHLIEPLGYEHFVYLLKTCFLVLTDSGGIQEEAPSFGKPVLVMRETTERPEAIDAGTVKLVGTQKSTIVKETTQLLNNSAIYNRMSRSHNPYGDGTASEQIVNFIEERLNEI